MGIFGIILLGMNRVDNPRLMDRKWDTQLQWIVVKSIVGMNHAHDPWLMDRKWDIQPQWIVVKNIGSYGYFSHWNIAGLVRRLSHSRWSEWSYYGLLRNLIRVVWIFLLTNCCALSIGYFGFGKGLTRYIFKIFKTTIVRIDSNFLRSTPMMTNHFLDHAIKDDHFVFQQIIEKKREPSLKK